MKKSGKVSVRSEGGPIFLDKVDNSGVISGRSDMEQLNSTSKRTSRNEKRTNSRWRTEKITMPIILTVITILGTICAALIGLLNSFISK